MFSLIKYLEGLLEKVRKNKGLWFTIITVISVIGMVTTLYIIMSMTSSVSQKVYKSMSEDYNTHLSKFLDNKKIEFEKIAILFTQNKNLLRQIEVNDEKNIEQTQKTINESYAKKGINNYILSVYSIANQKNILRPSVISTIKSKNSVYGIEVMKDGVFNVYLEPLIKDDKVYGVFEVKESIHNYRKHFEELEGEYVFLLDKKMLPKISIESKNGVYRDLIGDYTVAQVFYDTKFTASIPEIKDEEFKQMMQKNYLIDRTFYRAFKIVTDINGADIGIILIGEHIDKEDSFVNLADNMTKTVTTVALGLVISIMLFMF